MRKMEREKPTIDSKALERKLYETECELGSTKWELKESHKERKSGRKIAWVVAALCLAGGYHYGRSNTRENYVPNRVLHCLENKQSYFEVITRNGAIFRFEDVENKIYSPAQKLD